MTRVIGKGRYAGEVYPESAHGAAPPSAPLAPMDLVLWVGVTDVPPTVPNGTAVTDGTAGPFPNLQAAFDFVTALPVGSNTKVTYYVNSTVAGGATLPASGQHNIIGLDTRTGGLTLIITPAEEGDLTVGLRNIQGTAFIAGGTGHVFLNVSADTPGNGGTASADIVIDSSTFGGQVDVCTVGVFVQAFNCPNGNLRAYDCVFPSQGTISANRIDTCADCDIDASNTISVNGVPTGLGFVGCDFHNGPAEFQGPPGSVVLDPQSGLTFNTTTVLSGGATTNRAGDIGKVLTIVAPGLPRWV